MDTFGGPLADQGVDHRLTFTWLGAEFSYENTGGKWLLKMWRKFWTKNVDHRLTFKLEKGGP